MKKISRFIHVLNDECLWNAITKTAITVDKELVSYVKDNKGVDDIQNVPEKLEELGIITTPEDEAALIEKLKNQITDKQFQGLYLITSTKCNLDCDYCFYRCSISGSLKERHLMPFETAKKAVDSFKEIVKDNETYDGYWQQITLYGGEPMTNKPLLKQIIPYIHERFNDEFTDIVINTNLTLLDDEMMQVLKDNNVIVQVSLDGSRDIHDKHRVFANGGGSYDIVIQNAVKLRNFGVRVIPLITATNDNVDDFSNFVYDILEKLNTREFYSNVIITGTYDVSEDYFDKLAESMVELYEKILSKDGDCDFAKLCESILGNNKAISRQSCGGTRKITVFPDGNVYACQALQKLDINSMGTLDSDFSKSPNYDLWRQRNKFNNEECLDCRLIGSCGGGCATGSYNSTGSIFGVDHNSCEYSKALYRVLSRRGRN
jgi:uncharacterized protein